MRQKTQLAGGTLVVAALMAAACSADIDGGSQFDSIYDGSTGGGTAQGTGLDVSTTAPAGITGTTTGNATNTATAGVTTTTGGMPLTTGVAPAGTGGMTSTSVTTGTATTGGFNTGSDTTTGAATTGGAPFGGAGGSMGGGQTDSTSSTDGDTGSSTDGDAGAGGSGDVSTDGTSTTGSSSEECRVMQGEVPVCCTPQGSDREDVDEVFELLNAYRVSQGIDALAYDPVLEEAMQGHCKHMDQADFFAHESPVRELTTPWDRAEICGTSANAENIAAGQNSPAAVMDGWRNSSGHDRNMRSTGSSRVGIGKYGRYWGQIFGR